MIVDTASPDALCPPIGATRELVAARLGNVELEGTWHATYVLVHRSAGDFVVLSLRDPNGALRLERQFPVRGGSCVTLSQMIALVLERYFLRPGGEPREDGAAPAPPAPGAASPDVPVETEAPSTEPERAASAASDRGASSPSASRSIAVETARETRHPDAVWSIDAGLWATNAWLSPSLRLTRHVAGPLRLGLGAGLDLLDHEVRAGEGWVRTRRVPISLLGSVSFGHGPDVNPFLGVEVLGLFEQVSTKDLDETGDAARLVPGFGLRAGVDFLGSEKVGPFVELSGALLLRGASRPFEVDQREVAVPPALVFGAIFGIRAPF